MSVRHCAATTAPRNCCPNCYAEQSHKDNVRSSAVGKQLKQKKSNSISIAQHHLPDLDLFWGSFFLRVQLTSLLLISPELCGVRIQVMPFSLLATRSSNMQTQIPLLPRRRPIVQSSASCYLLGLSRDKLSRATSVC